MEPSSTLKLYCITLIILYVSFESYAESTNSIFNIIKQAGIMNSSSHPNTSEIIQSIPQKKHDYVLQINCILKPEEISSYLRDLTFHHHQMFNITPEDLIQLSGFEQYDLNKSMELLHKTNLSEEIISFENFQEVLDIANLTFLEFYEKLKNTTNLNGQPLQDALNILNVSPSNFSAALTFGSQASVYAVLEKGVFTEEKLGQAAAVVGSDLPKFYSNVKQIILERMRTKEMSYFVEKFKGKSWANQELFNKVWDAFDLQMQDVNSVVDFRRIIDNIFERLNANVSLAVATSQHEIVIHKRIYRNFENYQRIISLYAKSLVYPGKIYENLTLMKSPTNDSNFVKLWSNTTISTTVDIWNRMMALKAPPNCTYITVIENELVENPVNFVNVSNGLILVEPMVTTIELSVGNPLICNDKLTGLATEKMIEKNLFAFDTFFQQSENGTVSKSGSMKNNCLSFPMLLSIILNLLGLILIRY